VADYGTFTDRDGRKYKTVVIGNQTWFAENYAFTLPYAPIGCYYDFDDAYKKYGRLYTWYEAMRIAPEGWHLPSDEEWEILLKHCGFSDSKLKAKNVWYRGVSNDEYGFSALPGGHEFNTMIDYEIVHIFKDVEQAGCRWCSTWANDIAAFSYVISSESLIPDQQTFKMIRKDEHRSVRFVLD